MSEIARGTHAICRLACCLAALIVTPEPTPAAEAPVLDNWICVPGENGRWRCGQGSTDPQTSALPELPAPSSGGSLALPDAAVAEQQQPSIFILDRPPAGQPTPLELPPPEPQRSASGKPLGDPRIEGGFALKIASVSRVEEIADFVDSYGLDPNLVRYVRKNATTSISRHTSAMTATCIYWWSNTNRISFL